MPSYYNRPKGIPTPQLETGPNCDGCAYRTSCFGFAPGVGPTNARIMFVAEALGRDEVERGRPLVGPTGQVFNGFIRDFSTFHRPDVYITNVVKCRPIEYNGEDPVIQYNGDYKNCPPSPGQIRECTKRYLIHELEQFEGDTIVGLGNVPLRWFANGIVYITKQFSSIYELGELVECNKCKGTGGVTQPRRRCPVCNGKGHDGLRVLPPFISCSLHPNYKGIVRKASRCRACDRLHMQKHPICDECNGEKTFPRPPKPCPECGGDGKVAADPSRPFISTRLRPGQIFFPLFHPAFLMRQQKKYKNQQIQAWKRIEGLHAELSATNTGVDYIDADNTTPDMSVFGESVSMDIETSTLRPEEGEAAKIRCVSLSPGPKRSVVFSPTDSRMRSVLEEKIWIGQNITLFDAWWVHHKFRITPRTIHDTRFMAHLLEPDTPNDLTSITREFASPPMQGYWKTTQNYRDDIRKVCAIDSDATYRAYSGLLQHLETTGQLHIFLNDIVPLCSTVLDMRIRGMRIDKEKMHTMAKAYEEKIAFNRVLLPEGIDTENQAIKIREYLYKTIGLQPIRKKGKDTADKQALETLDQRLALNHKTTEGLTSRERREARSFIQRIGHLRKMSKLVSGFLRQELSSSGFVHPILNPGGTATLRLSCSDPNAQQIPPGARGIFIPDKPDQSIISADLKQAEVIGLLVFAEEWEVLCRVLAGEDVHGIVAEMLFGGGYSEEQRTAAKTTTFALLYGEHPSTTAVRLGITELEVHQLRQKYFAALPGIEEYRSAMLKSSMEKGYVENAFGYRRYIEVKSWQTEGREVNQACNAPIQNICPMVTRRAMNDLATTFGTSDVRLWMQVHDEVLAVAPTSTLDSTSRLIRESLSQGIPELRVPKKVSTDRCLHFPVDIAVGPNWGEMEKI